MEAIIALMSVGFFVLNIVLLVWTVQDAKKRGKSGVGWGFAVFFLGIFGWLLWLLTRPPSTVLSSPLQTMPYQTPQNAGSVAFVIPREETKLRSRGEMSVTAGSAMVVAGIIGVILVIGASRSGSSSDGVVAGAVMTFVALVAGVCLCIPKKRYAYVCPLCGQKLCETNQQAGRDRIGPKCERCGVKFWAQ